MQQPVIDQASTVTARPVPRCATRPTGSGRAGSQRRQPSGPSEVRPPRSRSQRWRLRLTRRGRAVLVVVVAALLLAAFSLGRVSTQAATDSPPAPRHVTVHAGETLWQLANRIAPHQDPRVVVADLERLNGLGGAGLSAGQELIVP